MEGKNALNFLAQAPAMIWTEFIVLIALTSLADCALLTAHPVILSHSYLFHSYRVWVLDTSHLDWLHKTLFPQQRNNKNNQQSITINFTFGLSERK